MQSSDINATPKNTIGRLAKDCYLAAACQHVGASAEVYEHFAVMKKFQEEHLPNDKIGLLYLKTYDKAAPQIVENINAHPSQNAIYAFIYQVIEQCVDAIRKGAFDAAHRVLVNMMHNIQLRYGVAENII
ncbi:hypothetical protein [uncultured Microscilla sp.]|uniref:hypothetical protein n=1 Tax=uncultured Microscilla sp. TaxID=432653 RepID=UPI0026094536|nr:hypothetical protein [uncultured Microscilla sp.]